MKIKSAEFVISNADYKLCPKDMLPEYAFTGRSNVGKSSLINSLFGKIIIILQKIVSDKFQIWINFGNVRVSL